MTIVKSCLNYQGNKYKLIKERRIHEYLPPINHDNPYCELFCGSAVMFFNLTSQNVFAFLNDINHELQNFWYVVKYHYAELIQELEYIWPGMNIDPYTQVERAAQFYISNINSNYITKPLRIDKTIRFWKRKLDEARLWIDCRPWEEEMTYVMKLYTNKIEDRPCRVIFYEDPPYYGCEDHYKAWRADHTAETIPKFDHGHLALKNAEARTLGHFILLSYNDVPEIRALYTDGWFIKSYTYTPNGKGTNRANERRELLISSHPFTRRHTLEGFL